MFLRRKYQRQKSKINARFCFSAFISWKPLLPVRRKLCRIWVRHSQQNDYCFISVVRKVGNTDLIILWKEFNGSFFLCGPPSIENHPSSRGLMIYIPTTQENFVFDTPIGLSFQILIIWGQNIQSVYDVTNWHIRNIFTQLRLT
jgi:hypothetical protein